VRKSGSSDIAFSTSDLSLRKFAGDWQYMNLASRLILCKIATQNAKSRLIYRDLIDFANSSTLIENIDIKI